jgi:hypothetical protein
MRLRPWKTSQLMVNITDKEFSGVMRLGCTRSLVGFVAFLPTASWLCYALPKSFNDESQVGDVRMCGNVCVSIVVAWGPNVLVGCNHPVPTRQACMRGRDRGSGSSLTHIPVARSNTRRRLGSFSTAATSREAGRPCRTCPVQVIVSNLTRANAVRHPWG